MKQLQEMQGNCHRISGSSGKNWSTQDVLHYMVSKSVLNIAERNTSSHNELLDDCSLCETGPHHRGIQCL